MQIFNTLVSVHVTSEHVVVSVQGGRAQVAIPFSHEAALMMAVPVPFGQGAKPPTAPVSVGPYHLEEHGVGFFLQPFARIRASTGEWVIVSVEVFAELVEDLRAILALASNGSFAALACRGSWSHQGSGEPPIRMPTPRLHPEPT